MKNIFLSIVVLMASLFSLSVFSQSNNEPEALGMPGDNLNLYAVLDIFQKSETLEAFEKSLNDKENNINNLDLNNDNKTDYISVISRKVDNSNIIVLRVPINSREDQDVAVIDVSKNKEGKINVQIIGDKNLYGKDYIVEPSTNANRSAGTPNPGYNGGGTVIINNNTTNNYNTTNNNANNNNGGYIAPVETIFPMFLFLFSPHYVVYHSPYHYGYYPPYWNPWPPVYYQSYWGYHNHYYGNPYYHRTIVVVNPHNYSSYSNGRYSSYTVINNNRRGNYDNTYNGQHYNKPAAPNQPNNRPNTSTNRPNTPAINNPNTRPNSPTARPSTPGTRPSTSTQNPSVPVNRPVTPTSRPSTPVSRPAPATKPATRPAGTTASPASKSNSAKMSR